MARTLSRRRFIQALGAGAAATLLPMHAYSADRKPNVLFIPVDDLNDWIGCLGGHPDTITPNLDRLAERGVLFTRAYCAAPLCNPSRAALMSGILPSQSGVYQNDQPWRPAMPDAVTLSQCFMRQGYRVMGGGKIFHGRFNDPASWQEYYERPADPRPDKRPVNGIENAGHFDWGPVDCDDEDMADWRLVDWAIERLNRTYDEPFFLAVGLIKPHLPWYVPRKYFDRFPEDAITLPDVKEDDLDDIPPCGRAMARPEGDHKSVIETSNWRKAVAGYLATINFVDACVGRLMDAFERSPHADNTIVVLWGDHGWHLGEKLHWRKFTLWEEATRNPFMMVVPGVTKPGGRCDRTVSLMDVYPTLVDLCGLDACGPQAGVTLRPLLENPQAEWDRPALTTYGRNNHSVRSEQWRYIRYHDGTEELYDHAKDPMEWTNLAGREDLAAVKKDLAQWFPSINAEDARSIGGGSGE
ncbi:MAG TPA: sulfatase [Candidatus Hydrogenedentes bacterium]|nr:sulfatase [Candidatus Hydrogenedentota bacterium]HPG66069.1 sulfatase [Candidatus Hydrogenedentota bacterium]